MVQSIGFSGNSGFSQYSREDIVNLAKFVGGVEILPQVENPFAGFGLMAGLTLLPELGKINQWRHMNGGYASAWTSDINAIKNNYKATKDVIAATGYSKETYKTLAESAKSANNQFLVEVANSKLARKQEAIAAGKTTLWEKIKGFVTGKSADTFAEKKVLKLTNKAADAVKVAEEATTASKALTLGAKASKFVKANGLFLVIEGGLAVFTQIIPTFSQLGTDKGMRQVGKSTVKVAGSVGGWAAGAAAGAAIGSVLPIAGTAIGAIVGGLLGVACGTLGSSLGTKLATAVVGKDELELAKEEEANKKAQLAINDPTQMQAILAEAGQKLQSEGAANPDSTIALKSYEKLAQNFSAQGATNSASQAGGQASSQFAAQGLDPSILQYLSPEEQAYLLNAYQTQSGAAQTTQAVYA